MTSWKRLTMAGVTMVSAIGTFAVLSDTSTTSQRWNVSQHVSQTTSHFPILEIRMIASVQMKNTNKELDCY